MIDVKLAIRHYCRWLCVENPAGAKTTFPRFESQYRPPFRYHMEDNTIVRALGNCHPLDKQPTLKSLLISGLF